MRRSWQGRRSKRLFRAVVGVSVGGLLATSLIVNAGTALAATSSVGTWTQQNPTTSPPVRDYDAMAYDPASNQLVLFGGSTGANVLNDTWVWDGSNWSQVADNGALGCTTSCPNSPPARAGASLAYDPDLGELVLFAGQNYALGDLNDTWVWNGRNWTQDDNAGMGNGCTTTCPDSPPADSGGSMAFDPASDQMVYFGGEEQNSTWAWNGAVWNQVADSGDAGCTNNCTNSPPVRSYAPMAFDPQLGEVVLFGGRPGLNDTWAWNGSAWSQIADNGDSGCTTTCTNSPSQRGYDSLDYDPALGQIVMFGGYSSTGGGYIGDTWAFDGTSWTQQSPEASPPPRGIGYMAYDSGTKQVVLFGGFVPMNGNYYFNDTWTYVPAVAPSAPVAVTALPGNAEANVYFVPPTSDGGTPITTYNVTATDITNSGNGGQTASGGSSPISVTGLTNGDSYVFTVTATNAVGTGEGLTSGAVVPATVPGAPTSIQASGRVGAAVVSFSAPSSDGGNPITSYTVTATDKTNAANGGQTASAPNSPITVSGLSTSDSYTFTVAATNAIGTGSASSPSNAVTPATSPSAPTAVKAYIVARGYKSAYVSFSPPASNGGNTVTSYTVTATDITKPSRGGERASGTSSPVLIGGLTAGDKYSFSVTATNAIGTGPSSANSAAIVIGGVASVTTLTLSAKSIVFGQEQKEVFTVSVTPRSPAVPTGQVLIAVSTKLFVVKLVNGTGKCSPSAKALSAGSFSVVAMYLGDKLFVPSRSKPQMLTVRG